MKDKVLLRIENLSKHYIVKKNIISPKTIIKAVDGVSFEILEGETLGLIGESGSGKTTLGNLVLNLIKKDQGKIYFKDIELSTLSGEAMRKLRKDIQIIFQHTHGALDPKMTVEELIKEPLKLHNIVPPVEIDMEINKLLDMVGLSKDDRRKFPHQLSGGQRQRIGIARAIASRPKFIVCDEPVSALDVSVQGQILNLLLDLKEKLNLTYLFISHDLKVVKHICDKVAVMYNGKILEIGPRDEIINNPKEEYTKRLIESNL